MLQVVNRTLHVWHSGVLVWGYQETRCSGGQMWLCAGQPRGHAHDLSHRTETCPGRELAME